MLIGLLQGQKICLAFIFGEGLIRPFKFRSCCKAYQEQKLLLGLPKTGVVVSPSDDRICHDVNGLQLVLVNFDMWRQKIL